MRSDTDVAAQIETSIHEYLLNLSENRFKVSFHGCHTYLLFSSETKDDGLKK